MTNKPRSAGTKWESQIVECLRVNGWPLAERRALQGALDKGDIAGLPTTIEAKACREWAPAEWVKELEAEMANAHQDTGGVWIKRRGKSDPAQAYVLMPAYVFLRLLSRAASTRVNDAVYFRATSSENLNTAGWQWPEVDES